jgi:hypothetical protein
MSSKRRVGVLEASASPDSSAPATFCGRAIAELLLEKQKARKIGKRLIQAIEGTAEAVIAWAKAERERAIKLWERQQLRLGIGNLVPFSRPTDPGQHFHYEIPHANDKGIRRWGFRSAASANQGKLLTRTIQVSARSRFSHQALATAATTTLAPSLADAFSQ